MSGVNINAKAALRKFNDRRAATSATEEKSNDNNLSENHERTKSNNKTKYSTDKTNQSNQSNNNNNNDRNDANTNEADNELSKSTIDTILNSSSSSAKSNEVSSKRICLLFSLLWLLAYIRFVFCDCRRSAMIKGNELFKKMRLSTNIRIKGRELLLTMLKISV